MLKPIVSVLLAATLTIAAAAQDLSLSGTYRITNLGGAFHGPCGSSPSFHSSFGSTTFASLGTWNWNIDTFEVCQGSTASLNTSSGSGSYEVEIGGELGLDFASGGSLSPFTLRPDFEFAMATQHDGFTPPQISLVIKDSAGQSMASLNGDYHIARLWFDHGGVAIADRSDFGTINFDGAGNWTELGDRTIVSGGPNPPVPYTQNGTYGVGPQGTIAFFAGTVLENGMMTGDGDLFYWVSGNPTSSVVSLAVGIRASTAANSSTFEGSWDFTQFGIEYVSGFDPIEFSAETGTLQNTPFSPTSGTVDVTAFDVTTNSFGSYPGFDTVTVGYDVQPNGQLTIFDPFGGINVDGAVSAGGKFLIGVIAEHSDEPALIVGARKVGWPAAYGFGTPGTGGEVPALGGYGAFPALGNSGFALQLQNGLSSAPALISLTLAAGPPIPFLGGTILVDFGQSLADAPITLDGGGTFTLGLPLSSDPVLDGVQIFAQGFVLDAGAPQGLSMSNGLQFEIGR